MERDPYAVLGVARDADLRALKRAYRALARKLHPDVSSEKADHARFLEVRRAYDLLSDPERRREYDLEAARAARCPARERRFRPAVARAEGRVTGSRRVIVDALLTPEEARCGMTLPFRFHLGPRAIDIDLELPPGTRTGDRISYRVPVERELALTFVVHIEVTS
jgi:curved DNA-binding protein CbpA